MTRRVRADDVAGVCGQSAQSRERHTGRAPMKAIVVTDEAAGTAGMTLVERPEPPAAGRAAAAAPAAGGLRGAGPARAGGAVAGGGGARGETGWCGVAVCACG